MSFLFNSRQGLIVVDAELEGPSCTAVLRLALYTGATNTLINPALLVAVGFDPALAPLRLQITTGSRVEFVPQVSEDKLRALAQERTSFMVLAHTLPPSATVDGLLGLDFLRGLALHIDFRQGKLSLT
jgi:hypothetical protein